MQRWLIRLALAVLLGYAGSRAGYVSAPFIRYLTHGDAPTGVEQDGARMGSLLGAVLGLTVKLPGKRRKDEDREK